MHYEKSIIYFISILVLGSSVKAQLDFGFKEIVLTQKVMTGT